MGVTIYDIAKKTGVSITTVSRVVNGNYPVSEKTRRRVLRTIRELGYSPNHVARSLATSFTSTLGVVGADLRNPYFSEMINAIQNAAAPHSLQILLQNTRDAQGEAGAVRLLMERRVDGIIFVALHDTVSGFEHIRSAAERSPVVVIGLPVDGANIFCVQPQHAMGSYLLAKELLDCGHRNFLFLGGRPESHVTERRLDGVRRALEEYAGCRLDLALTGYSYDSGAMVAEWLKSGLADWCTAIVAVSDY